MGRSVIKGNIVLPGIQAAGMPICRYQQETKLITIFRDKYPWKIICRCFWGNKNGERFRNPPTDS